MLPELHQPTTKRVSRTVRRAVEQRYDTHLVQLTDEHLTRDRAAERLHGGGELLSLAGSLVATMALAEANLATVNPSAAYRVTALIDRFTGSAADVIDAYMRRPM